MFHKKSLEEQLRQGGGRSAPATILDEHEGKVGHGAGAIGSSGFGVRAEHYQVRVEPGDGSSFDAEVSVGGLDLPLNPQPGVTVVVLYDPADHTKVAIDVGATNKKLMELAEETWAREEADERAAAGGSSRDALEEIEKLAKLRDQGALTPDEFLAEKKKLLND